MVDIQDHNARMFVDFSSVQERNYCITSKASRGSHVQGIWMHLGFLSFSPQRWLKTNQPTAAGRCDWHLRTGTGRFSYPF